MQTARSSELSQVLEPSKLKVRVRNFWGSEPCGTHFATGEKFTRDYYEQIEQYRYDVEPQIFSFAQFTRYHGKRVLEVGVGVGTDFLQWVRAGAEAHGIDITAEGIEHVRRRLELYGLKASELKVADAEALPYPDGHFDLVYSWGVIHHSPDTLKALAEIVRVTRPGGMCKIMVYNRCSLGAFYLWMKYALLKGGPWKSIAWCLAHYQESPGTKGYTVKEFQEILKGFPVTAAKVRPVMTYVDTLSLSSKWPVRLFGALAGRVLGPRRFGWFLTIEFVVTG